MSVQGYEDIDKEKQTAVISSKVIHLGSGMAALRPRT